MAGCPSASWVFSQEIVGICKSTPCHLLVLNRAMYSQSQLLELDWLRRRNLLFLLPPLPSLIVTHNASLSGGQDPAEGGNFRLLSNSSSKGARDTGWRSLFYHYSLEPLTVALPNLRSPLVTSPPPVTLSTNPRLMKLNRPFPWATLWLHVWMGSGERAGARLLLEKRRISSVQTQALRFPGFGFLIAASQSGHGCSTITYWTRSH